MLSQCFVRFLLVFSCVLAGSSVGYAQVGRLLGNVAYLDAYRRVSPARGASVLVSGAYGRAQTRTDNNGNFAMMLPAGSYDVRAEGLSGYTQRTRVGGYVRPNSDNYISPNPLLLVSAYLRMSIESGIIEPDSVVRAISSKRADGWHAEPRFILTGSPDNRVDLTGSVSYEKPRKPGAQLNVWATSLYHRTTGTTDANGLFTLKVSTGTWFVCVQPPAGYHQDKVPQATVQNNQPKSLTILLVRNSSSSSPPLDEHCRQPK